jgi:dihydrofolate reductase
MRKIVAGLFISLDGVVEAPDQWQMPYMNDEIGEFIDWHLVNADALLLGRKTYQEFASFWPNETEMSDMADLLNGKPKLVASNTLDTLDWQNSTLVSGNVMEKLAELKQEPGDFLTMTGSVTLVRSLLAADLLDELHLLLHPVVVGKGARLFEHPSNQRHLNLFESKTYDNGSILLSYRPSGH